MKIMNISTKPSIPEYELSPEWIKMFNNTLPPRVIRRFKYEIHYSGVIITDNIQYPSYYLAYVSYIKKLIEIIKYNTYRIDFMKKSEHYIIKSYFTSHTDQFGKHRNNVPYSKMEPIVIDLSK